MEPKVDRATLGDRPGGSASRVSVAIEPKVDTAAVDGGVAQLAARQYGLVTRRQLEAAGLRPGAIAHRVRRGRLHRIHRGVYSVGHELLTGDGRFLAAVLALGDGAVVSHLTAADHLDIRPSSRAQIDVTVPSQAGRLARPGINLHRSRRLSATDVTVVRRIPVTTPARTLVDIAGVLRPAQLERAVDRAEAIGLFDLRAVEACLTAASPSRRGRASLAAVLEQRAEPALTRSELEGLFLDLCAANELPRPRVNALAGGFEVDFLWPKQRIIVETDGHAHHGTRAAFERDRERDARLTAAGYRVLRFTYRQIVYEQAFVVGTLHSVLGSP